MSFSLTITLIFIFISNRVHIKNEFRCMFLKTKLKKFVYIFIFLLFNNLELYKYYLNNLIFIAAKHTEAVSTAVATQATITVFLSNLDGGVELSSTFPTIQDK